MAELVKQWNDGGSLSVTYEGNGDGSAVFSSDVNSGAERVMDVSFIDDSRSVIVVRTVRQAAGQVSTETYTRLTFIEATGSQYINLDYIVQEDDVIDMYYITTLNSAADKMLFGVSDGTNGLWHEIYSSAGYARFGHNASVTVSGSRTRYKVRLAKGSVVVDDLTASLTYTAMPDLPAYLFARNNKGDADCFGHYMCTGFKISKSSGEIVMDLRPCKRDSDGKVGMIDLVSGRFFENQGIGDDFVAGSEIRVDSGYEVLDYVTFNANKVFDAGIIDSTQTIEVLFERTETAKTPYLYGIITSPHTASVTAYMGASGAWRFGSSYRGLTTTTLKMYKVEVSRGKTVFDFTSGTFTSSTFTTPNTLIVGGYRNASGTVYKSYIGYLYYFRIKVGSELVADWYPCKRLSDDVEGFWDCVTQTFIEPL